MIPSLVNLVIGGTSLVRGLSGVPSLLLRYIPERGGVLKWDRPWIATLISAQVAAGSALGIDSQALLVVVIIGYVMPLFGLELLDMARDVAAFNLPARVGQLFGVSLYSGRAPERIGVQPRELAPSPATDISLTAAA